MAGESNARSLNAETSSLSKQKPGITLNAFGLSVGKHSTQLASRCSEIVGTVVPISIKDWRLVPKNVKDELWKLVQEDYVVPHSYKAECLKGMCNMMRKYKTKLRSKYLDAHATPEKKLNNHPPGVRPEDWEAFMKDVLSPKTIEPKKIQR